jgi:hypothetical protein
MTALWLRVCAGAQFHAAWKQRSRATAWQDLRSWQGLQRCLARAHARKPCWPPGTSLCAPCLALPCLWRGSLCGGPRHCTVCPRPMKAAYDVQQVWVTWAVCVCVRARARVCLCSGAMMLWCSGAGPRSVRSACNQLLLWCSVAGPCSVDLPAAWLCLGGVAWPAGHLICWQVSHRTAGAMTALWLLVCAGARFHAAWRQPSHSVARLAELAGAAAVFGTCARAKALLAARHVSVRALPCLALPCSWRGSLCGVATPLHCVSKADGGFS